MCQIRDATGTLQTGDTDVAEVFASFYEDLYKVEGESSAIPGSASIANEVPVSPAELNVTLKQLKNNKTRAEDGLVAEMLKTGHAALVDADVDHDLPDLGPDPANAEADPVDAAAEDERAAAATAATAATMVAATVYARLGGCCIQLAGRMGAAIHTDIGKH